MRYKRDLYCKTSNGEIRIAANERPLLTVTVACPHCHKLSKQDLLGTFTSMGVDGAHVEFWYFICGQCNEDIARPTYEATKAHFAMLQKNHPEFAGRLRSIFEGDR